MKRTLIALLSLCPLVGCERAAESDVQPLAFQYFAPEQDHSDNESAPFDACDLTGPHETLVYATLVSDFQIHLNWDDCSKPAKYRTDGAFAQLEVERQTGPATVPAEIRSLWFHWVDVDETVVSGAKVVASVRQAGDVWVVGNYVRVEPTSDGELANDSAMGEVDLPSTWSGLAAEADALRPDFASQCKSVETGADENKLMTDSEFSTWAQTPASLDNPCNASPDSGEN